jgi:pre-mRNA-splicing factor ATP-dependent RNA helicase DHX38/PRP16
MGENFKRKKSNEQKIWEQRKLKMAGIDTDDLDEISDDDSNNIILRDEYKRTYHSNVCESLFDFENEMYLIGNRQSLYYEKYKNRDRLIKLQTSFGTKIEANKKFDFRDLPVYKNKNNFLNIFDKNDSIVISGETGCGKSTLIPKFIYDEYKFNICVTQPRRISVKSLYERMKIFYKSEVGYAVRYEQEVSKNTKIKFVTEGVLLRELSDDPFLSKYDVIICDEVHERSVNLDLILGFLKIIRKKRTDLKIVLMSATLQIEKFSNFLNCIPYHFDGNRFPVDIRYLKINVDDYVEWVTKKILSVHNDEEEGDILVFLSGKEDIHQVKCILEVELEQNYEDLMIIPLYSEILNDVYDKIFNLDTKTRKCILSTNVAEASVTISNIRFVIDSGFQKISFYDYNQGDRLIKYPISKESAIQRAGRAGRTMPGTCYRMYTEETFRTCFKDYTVPDILRANISNTILLLLSTNYKNIKEFPFLSFPSEIIISAGIDMLISLEAIDYGLNITNTGQQIIKLGIDPVLGKLIILGILYSCSYEASLLASILSLDVHNIFNLFEKKKEHPKFIQCINQNNDFLTLINLFKWGFEDKTIIPHLVSKVRIIQDNLLSRIKSLGAKISHSPQIEIVVIKTFYFNLCKRDGNSYIHLGNLSKYKLSKSSADHQYIIFYKSFGTRNGENVLQVCCKVDSKDILSHLGKYFTDEVKHENVSNKIIVNPYEKLYDRFIIDSEEEDIFFN